MQKKDMRKIKYTPSEHERWWTGSLYFSGLLCFVFPLFFLAYVIIVWNLKKKDSLYMAEKGREALNFHLSYTILSASLLGIVTLMSVFMAFSIIFIPFMPGLILMFGAVAAVLFIMWVVGCIYCGLKTLTCTTFKYPLVYPIFKK